jgi:hypothetical protein
LGLTQFPFKSHHLTLQDQVFIPLLLKFLGEISSPFRDGLLFGQLQLSLLLASLSLSLSQRFCFYPLYMPDRDNCLFRFLRSQGIPHSIG